MILVRHGSSLTTSIEFLKGVDPKQVEILASELGIRTFRGLLNHFPFRYEDRTKFYKVKEIHGDLPYVQLAGELIIIFNIRIKSGKESPKMLIRYFPFSSLKS